MTLAPPASFAPPAGSSTRICNRSCRACGCDVRWSCDARGRCCAPKRIVECGDGVRLLQPLFEPGRGGRRHARSRDPAARLGRQRRFDVRAVARQLPVRARLRRVPVELPRSRPSHHLNEEFFLVPARRSRRCGARFSARSRDPRHDRGLLARRQLRARCASAGALASRSSARSRSARCCPHPARWTCSKRARSSITSTSSASGSSRCGLKQRFSSRR